MKIIFITVNQKKRYYVKILFLLLIPFLNAEISSIFGLLQTSLTLTWRYDIHIQDIKIKKYDIIIFYKIFINVSIDKWRIFEIS